MPPSAGNAFCDAASRACRSARKLRPVALVLYLLVMTVALLKDLPRELTVSDRLGRHLPATRGHSLSRVD